MAWPRIKNSRSSAQPGTQPHDGVQATVTPAPDAEPPPGSGQNTGVSGTRHSVAYEQGGYGPGAPTRPPPGPGPGAACARSGTRTRQPTRRSRRPFPSRRPAASRHGSSRHGVSKHGVSEHGRLRRGTPRYRFRASAVRHRGRPARPRWTTTGTTTLPRGWSTRHRARPTPGLPALGLPALGLPALGLPMPGPLTPGRLSPPAAPVPNEGLEIFGDVATTEVPDDDDEDVPARDYERPSSPEPTRVIPIGATWNQPVSAQARPSDEAGEDGGRARSGGSAGSGRAASRPTMTRRGSACATCHRTCSCASGGCGSPSWWSSARCSPSSPGAGRSP